MRSPPTDSVESVSDDDSHHAVPSIAHRGTAPLRLPVPDVDDFQRRARPVLLVASSERVDLTWKLGCSPELLSLQPNNLEMIDR